MGSLFAVALGCRRQALAVLAYASALAAGRARHQHHILAPRSRSAAAVPARAPSIIATTLVHGSRARLRAASASPLQRDPESRVHDLHDVVPSLDEPAGPSTQFLMVLPLVETVPASAGGAAGAGRAAHLLADSLVPGSQFQGAPPLAVGTTSASPLPTVTC